MNSRYRLLSLVVATLLLSLNADAQLFQQNFSTPLGPLQGTSTTPIYLVDANYVSATPTNSQFTHIAATGSSVTTYTSVYVDGSGTLTMDRVSAGNGAAVRNFPLTGPPTSVLVKFDFNVTLYRSSGSAAGNYVNFNVGTSFDTGTGRPAGGYAKFGIGYFRTTGTDSGWYVNNINSGTTVGPTVFHGWQTITFAVNGSGGTGSYTAPGGATETVADQTWDLWVGTTKEFDDQPILDNTQTLSAFKLVLGSGSGRVAFDNLQIDPLIVVGVENEPTIPQRTALEQNYPNPFNPSTTLQIALAERGLTVVKVFDLMGRELATLMNEVKEPGTYTLRFDGSDLPSGVYLCRMQGGAASQTRKLVLLK